jgi:hypothetical protein
MDIDRHFISTIRHCVDADTSSVDTHRHIISRWRRRHIIRGHIPITNGQRHRHIVGGYVQAHPPVGLRRQSSAKQHEAFPMKESRRCLLSLEAFVLFLLFHQDTIKKRN